MSVVGVMTSELLALSRQCQEATFDRSVTIQRATPSRDTRGGTVRGTYSTALTVSGRVGDVGIGSITGVEAERVNVRNQRMVTMPAGTDVRVTDRLLIDGVTYEVVELLGGGGLETAKRAVVAAR